MSSVATDQADTSIRKRRIFISTGEVSGDLQGALLIEALHQVAAERGLDLEVYALGGERMAQAGAKLLGETTAIGSVGVFEAIPYILPTLRLQSRAQTLLQETPPDLAVLIDYMGPNLKIGQTLRQQFPGIPVVYYIAPQQWVWAFSKKDTEQIVANSDRMVAIFQEEAKYFRGFGADVTWVGHPLVDRFSAPADKEAARQALGIAPETSIITLLPASRRQELRYLMPRLLKAAKLLQERDPELQFLVPVSSQRFQTVFETALNQYGLRGRVITEQTQQAIAAADVAITKSGTANLEIALMNVPQVVAYRINPISAWFLYYLLKFKISFASPVNLAVNKAVVPEFLQWQLTPEALADAAWQLLTDPTTRQTMLNGYQDVRQALGEPGVCRRAAAEILDCLTPTPVAP
jgi:lipid-A-disaccharide synthase